MPVGHRARAGRRLWKSVIDDADSQDVDLDSLELSHLADAAALADALERLTDELNASPTGLMVKGYQGQPVAHPLLAEMRQTRAPRSMTLARIRVSAPEEKQSSGVVLPLGVQQRDAANKRWRKNG